MAPLAMAAIPAVIGAYTSYKSAKDAKKQAAKGVNETSTSTRTPYGPATSHINDILNHAKEQYDKGPQGPMPYAWQNFLNNPTSPGAGADSTYGGQQPGGGGAAAANLTWRGKDKTAVQAAKTERQNARTEARKAPTAAQAAQVAPPPGGSPQGSPAAPGPQFQAQGGPFGYSQGIRDYMMDKYQQQGVQGYQPAMNYIQGLLGGQSQNPMLSQAFQRVSNYQPGNYFSSFMPQGGSSIPIGGHRL